MHSLRTFAWVLASLLALTVCAGAAEEGGTAALFAQIKARSIGPAAMSGRITAIDFVPGNPKIIYVGSASGGLWKSVNAGTTFAPIFDDMAMSIGCLAVDQAHPDTVWAGTGECNVRNSVSIGTGLYRSLDGGKNWDLMGFAESERIARIVINPKEAGTIYVAVLGHLWNDHDQRGVYKTVDGGKTWQRVLFVDNRTGCSDLAMDPAQPDTLYAAMWQFRRLPWFFTSGGPGSALYKTSDGGKTWKKLGAGLPGGELGRIAVAVAPSAPETVFALVEAKETAMYRSQDRGENWTKVNASFAVKQRPFYFSAIEVDPRNAKKIFVSGIFFAISEDGGANFSLPFVSGGMSVHSDIHPIRVDPTDSKHVLLGTDGGVYVSEDGARTFRFLANLPLSQFYHVAFDLKKPYMVYGGLQDNGSWIGPSASPAGGIRNREWLNVGMGDGFYVYPHAQDADIVYYSWQGGNLMRLNTRTRETKDIKPLPAKGNKYRFNWNAAVAVGRHHADTIFLGGQYLFRSRDRGDSWEAISPDLTTNDSKKLQQSKSGGLTIDNTSAENHCTIFTIAESALSPDLIWVGTDDGKVQLTRDGGRTWTSLEKNIPGLPANTWCSCIEAGHYDPGTVYAVFDGHRTGDMKPYVYRTADFGKTWTALASAEIKGYCHVVREDTKKPNLLFLGTEFGLHASIDGGKTWARCKKTVPPVAVNDLAIHPRENDLIIATHGRGIYIIDDLTPLREIDDAVLAAAAAVLPSRPTLIRPPALFQDFPGDAEFVGENPGSGAFISYYLKKRHIFGDMKLEILDAAGKTIKSLPTSKGAGLNRVFWNMRLKSPKTAASRDLESMVTEGPPVPEGLYTVRLIKGGQAYTGHIELKYDPDLPYSSAERQVRYQAIMKLYTLLEDMAYTADSLKSLQEQSAALQRQLAADKTAKKLCLLLGDLGKKAGILHATIVKGEELFGEERLRERALKLYSALMTYGGRPTGPQLQHVAVVEQEIGEADAKFQSLQKTELAAVNRALQVKKLAPLKILSKEEYRKQE